MDKEYNNLSETGVVSYLLSNLMGGWLEIENISNKPRNIGSNQYVL